MIKISFNMQNEFIWVLCRIFVTIEIYIPLTPSIAFSTTEGIMQNYFKNAIPVLFDHLTLKPNLTAKNRDKCMLKYYRKTTLLKMYCRQIWLYLFMLRRITLKQLKSLISIDTFSCIRGVEVTLQTGVS